MACQNGLVKTALALGYHEGTKMLYTGCPDDLMNKGDLYVYQFGSPSEISSLFAKGKANAYPSQVRQAMIAHALLHGEDIMGHLTNREDIAFAKFEGKNQVSLRNMNMGLEMCLPQRERPLVAATAEWEAIKASFVRGEGIAGRMTGVFAVQEAVSRWWQSAGNDNLGGITTAQTAPLFLSIMGVFSTLSLMLCP
jgi:hypothetical protein